MQPGFRKERKRFFCVRVGASETERQVGGKKNVPCNDHPQKGRKKGKKNSHSWSTVGLGIIKVDSGKRGGPGYREEMGRGGLFTNQFRDNPKREGGQIISDRGGGNSGCYPCRPSC